MEEGFVTINGRNIWYAVMGRNQSGTPLLVVHGGPGFRTLTEHFEVLSLDRPVYFYDQSGCGRSDPAASPDDYSVAYFVEELDNVRQLLDLSEVSLYGHSWGGTLITAYYLQRRPEGIKSLILASPFISGPRNDENVQANIRRLPGPIQELFGKMAEGTAAPEEMETATMAYSLTYSCRKPVSSNLMQAFMGMNQEIYGKMNGPNEMQLTGTLKDLDLTPDLKSLDLPVLVMGGDSDEFPVEELRRDQLAIPGAQLAILPNASHTFTFDAPEIFQAIVRRFLNALS